MTLQSTKHNGIVIDNNIKMIIPIELKLIYQCKNGFWWAEKTSSKHKQSDKTQGWEPSKTLLHEGGRELKPVRTNVQVSTERKTYVPKRIEVNENDQVIIISSATRT